LLFIAGHSPKKDGRYPYLGKVGAEVTLEQGQESARNCVMNCLASVQEHLGDLNRVKGVIKLVGYVASAPTFTRQPEIINAASDLLIALFGEAGRHARTSVGMAVLPGDIPVEIDMVLEVETT
jgi:enamine deaminase RidA (YjgF/YER057c/UK114 family)